MKVCINIHLLHWQEQEYVTSNLHLVLTATLVCLKTGADPGFFQGGGLSIKREENNMLLFL